METITIQCTKCDSRLRLSASLLERVEGKAGRVSCKSCGQSIRVDGRGDGFSFDGAVHFQEIDELDGDEFVSDPAASPVFSTMPPEEMRLSGAPSEVTSSEASDRAVAADDAVVECETLIGDTTPAEAPFYRNELSSLSPHTIDDTVEDELARLPSGAASSPFNSSPFNEEMAPESVDDLYAQVAVPRSERSEQLAQQLEERLAESSAIEQEAPLPPALVESAETSSEARIVAATPMARRRTDAPPSPPTTRAKPQTSIPPAPPRPWELSKAPPVAPAAPVNPFEGEFGLSEPPPMAQTVHLTHDGRLINASDEPGSGHSKTRGALWATLAAAAAVGLAIVGVQSGALASVQGQLAQLGDGASAPRLARIADVMVGAEATQPQAASSRSDVGPIYTSLRSAEDIPIAEEPALNEAKGARGSEPAEQDDAETAARSESAPAEPAAPSEGDDAGAEPTDSESTDAAVADEASADEGAEVAEASAEPADASAEAAPTDAPAEDEAAPLPAFDRTAAGVALNEATAQAASCRKPGDPSGMARIVVSFAPSGRATRATVSGPPFAGTPTGGCIASRFRGARVPAFSGKMVTVSKTVVVR